MLKEYDHMNYNTTSSPLDPNDKLMPNKEKLLPDLTHCRNLVGKFNFLINTRPDLACGMQYLIQFMEALREPHYKVFLQVWGT